MTEHEIETERLAQIEYLYSIIDEYRELKKNNKKWVAVLFAGIILILVFALFNMFTGSLGLIWGSVVSIIILFGLGYCIATLGIKETLKNSNTKEQKILAYKACATMETLVKMANGTDSFRKLGRHLITINEGTHYSLYRQFVKLYPDYKIKELRTLSRIKSIIM